LGDSLIASVAASRGLVLVTMNTQDFKNFESLRLENWSL
jgi:predicted nucleic acid-binding protein